VPERSCFEGERVLRLIRNGGPYKGLAGHWLVKRPKLPRDGLTSVPDAIDAKVLASIARRAAVH
jgi:hypothetical protein